jgi:hypothetical protein
MQIYNISCVQSMSGFSMGSQAFPSITSCSKGTTRNCVEVEYEMFVVVVGIVNFAETHPFELIIDPSASVICCV